MMTQLLPTRSLHPPWPIGAPWGALPSASPPACCTESLVWSTKPALVRHLLPPPAQRGTIPEPVATHSVGLQLGVSCLACKGPTSLDSWNTPCACFREPSSRSSQSVELPCVPVWAPPRAPASWSRVQRCPAPSSQPPQCLSLQLRDPGPGGLSDKSENCPIQNPISTSFATWPDPGWVGAYVGKDGKKEALPLLPLPGSLGIPHSLVTPLTSLFSRPGSSWKTGITVFRGPHLLQESTLALS